MFTNVILMLIACCASLIMTPVIRNFALRLGAVDEPGGRKIHLIAVPRLGGVSVVVAVCMTVLAAHGLEGAFQGFVLDIEAWMPVFVGASIVFLVGFWDDLRPLPAWVKFIFQAAAACLAMWLGVRIESLFGGPSSLGVFAIPLTFLWIVGLTNAFNLIDGLDGLAAGLGFIAAGTSATIFFMGGGASEGLLLLILAGALAGFLVYNFHPASIFLGDSGSQVIGYVLAVTAITGSQKGATALPVIIPLLVFGLPIVDTLLSIARRAFRNPGPSPRRHATMRERMRSAKHIFKGDRDHVHHRLLAMGFSHRSAVLMLYGFAAGLSSLALIAVAAEYRNASAILLAVIIVAYISVRRLGYEEVAMLRIGNYLRRCERIVSTRLSFLIMLDVILIATAYYAAFVLKYDGLALPGAMGWYLFAFPCVLLIQISVFVALGLYRGGSRVMDIADLLPVSVIVGIAVLFSYVLSVIFDPPQGVSAFFGIDALLLQVLLLGGRSAYKILMRAPAEDTTEGGHVLIYGAGRRGESIVRELAGKALGLRPIGFLDDDPNLIGRTIDRVEVMGSSRDMARILTAHPIKAIIISSQKIGPERLVAAMNVCAKHQVPVLCGHFQSNALSLMPVMSEQPYAAEYAVAAEATSG